MGYKWVYMQRCSILKIKITVYHGSAVNASNFIANAEKVKVGNLFLVLRIRIDGTNEYLILISGATGSSSPFGGVENEVVKSICFMTNLNVYGPYGNSNNGTAFSHDVKDGVVVGFHGCASSTLMLLGFM
ncbi:putative jacalin-like lectin domain-containing protein [Helianthus anomalus]